MVKVSLETSSPRKNKSRVEKIKQSKGEKAMNRAIVGKFCQCQNEADENIIKVGGETLKEGNRIR